MIQHPQKNWPFVVFLVVGYVMLVTIVLGVLFVETRWLLGGWK